VTPIPGIAKKGCAGHVLLRLVSLIQARYAASVASPSKQVMKRVFATIVKIISLSGNILLAKTTPGFLPTWQSAGIRIAGRSFIYQKTKTLDIPYALHVRLSGMR